MCIVRRRYGHRREVRARPGESYKAALGEVEWGPIAGLINDVIGTNGHSVTHAGVGPGGEPVIHFSRFFVGTEDRNDLKQRTHPGGERPRPGHPPETRWAPRPGGKLAAGHVRVRARCGPRPRSPRTGRGCGARARVRRAPCPGAERGRRVVAGLGVDEQGARRVQRDGQLDGEMAPGRARRLPGRP